MAADGDPMVKALIVRLDCWLTANRPEYYAMLQSGATEAELDAVETQFSLVLPGAFRQLYRWRSGQDPMSAAALQMNRSFCTLEEVVSTKGILDGMIGDRWFIRHRLDGPSQVSSLSLSLTFLHSREFASLNRLGGHKIDER